jgi:hypothetical protein
MLGGSVIGGIDMSADVGTGFEGFDSPANHWHGSHVAGILAGHGAIIIRSDSLLYQAISSYSSPPQEASSFGFPGYFIVPLLGIAPSAKLFIIKVFPHTGAGVSESVIIAAIEKAIDLKVTDGLDVDVINMSLGGASLFDGRDLEDQTVDAATAVGITVVSAAGNSGPASNTVSSPGTAHTGIAAAAAAHPINTRVLWDILFGRPRIGKTLFVSDDPQIIAFSSRGPTSDGRGKHEIAATGVFVLSAFPSVGNPNGIAFASGTSMATPGVAGGVALLNTASEQSSLGATPEDFKQALMAGATPLPGYSPTEQGAGYMNVGAALSALLSDTSFGDVAAPLSPGGTLVDLLNTGIVGSGTFAASIGKLEPGMNEEFVFVVTSDTASVRVDLEDVVIRGRNPLGINSLELYIQSAIRTTDDLYVDSANVFGDSSVTITDDDITLSGPVFPFDMNPHVLNHGFMKVVVENDWTSSDDISVDVTITVTAGVDPTPDFVGTGSVATGDFLVFGFVPPSGTTTATITLTWENDWSRYPTSDLDLIVFWNDGIEDKLTFSGATLNAPERLVVSDTAVVSLTIIVFGFSVPTGASESFALGVSFGS